MRKILSPLVVLLLVFAATAVNIQAQYAPGQRIPAEAQLAASNSAALTPTTPATSSLPCRV